MLLLCFLRRHVIYRPARLCVVGTPAAQSHLSRHLIPVLGALIACLTASCTGPANTSTVRPTASLSGSRWEGDLLSRDGTLHGQLTLLPSSDQRVLSASLKLYRPGLGDLFARVFHFRAKQVAPEKLLLSGMPDGLRSIQATISPAHDRLYGTVTDRHNSEARFSFVRSRPF